MAGMAGNTGNPAGIPPVWPVLGDSNIHTGLTGGIPAYHNINIIQATVSPGTQREPTISTGLPGAAMAHQLGTHKNVVM